MPLAYRVPFQSTCGVFWTLYLSLLNSRQALLYVYDAIGLIPGFHSENKTLKVHEQIEKYDSQYIYQRIQRDAEEELRTWEEAKDHARHH